MCSPSSRRCQSVRIVQQLLAIRCMTTDDLVPTVEVAIDSVASDANAKLADAASDSPETLVLCRVPLILLGSGYT